MLSRLDRVVLGGQAERVIAHRLKDAEALAALEVGDGVADRIDLEVADVGLPGGVWQHHEHVALRRRVVEAGLAGVGHLPGVLPLPDLLPAGLDRLGVVAVHRAEFTSASPNGRVAAADTRPVRIARRFGCLSGTLIVAGGALVCLLAPISSAHSHGAAALTKPVGWGPLWSGEAAGRVHRSQLGAAPGQSQGESHGAGEARAASLAGAKRDAVRPLRRRAVPGDDGRNHPVGVAKVGSSTEGAAGRGHRRVLLAPVGAG